MRSTGFSSAPKHASHAVEVFADDIRVLSDAECEEATTVAGRLTEEFSLLLAALPQRSRKIRELSDYLGVNWNTCQRLLAAIKVRGEPLQVLLRLPGVQGLEGVVETARAKGCSLERVEAAAAATTKFASLITRVGGSHARLRSRIEYTLNTEQASGPAGDTEREIKLRRRLFVGAVELMGKQTDLQLSISIVRPLPNDPVRIERAGATGFIGQQTRWGATPLAATFAHSSDRSEAKDPSISYRGIDKSKPSALLKTFSTTPLPTVMTRGPQGGVVHVVDPAATQGDNKIDVVLSHRMAPVSHPATHETPTMNLLSRIRSPVRRMVFDVYLHRSLAKSSVPLVGAYLSLPSPDPDSTPRWHERLPGHVELRLLGSGTDGAPSDAWHRHAELTNYLFNELSWGDHAFVGFRCDVRFPLCGTTYMMSFDFDNSDEQADNCAEP